MRTQLSLSLLALVLSCNPPGSDGVVMDDPPADPGKPKPNQPPVEQNQEGLKSGSRLKQRFAVGEDGSQRHLATWDSKLNLECNFEEAEDGKLRCLPTLAAGYYRNQYPSQPWNWEYFKDYNCSERIALSSLCQPAARYIKFTDTCGGKTRIANAVEIATPTTVYYRSSDGTCRSQVTKDNGFATFRLYTFGPPVSPEEFVAATTTTE